MRNHPKYETIEQIRAIKWVGNHHADSDKMNGINAYVLANHETRPDECREALYLLGKDGMGVDDPVSEEDLRREVVAIKEFAALGYG